MKTYKNQFVERTRKEGLGPEIFSTKETTLDGAPVLLVELCVQPSLKYVVVTDPNSLHHFRAWSTRFEVGFPKHNFFATNRWDRIEQVLEIFERWLCEHVQPYLDEMLQLV